MADEGFAGVVESDEVAADGQPELVADAVVVAPSVVPPGEVDSVINAEVARASAIRANAAVVEVRTAAEEASATDALGEIASALRESEKQRKWIVDPINKQVKAINARFKPVAEALEDASREIKDKVLVFRQEQARLAEVEQARLDAEHREREAQAAEERKRLEDVARQEREAAAREATRLAAEAKAAAEKANEPARLAAQWAADQARRAEEAARQAEAEVAAAPVAEIPRAVVARVTPARTASATAATTRKEWKAQVVDPLLVPREFLLVDQAKINAAVRDAVRAKSIEALRIPGVMIGQVDNLAVRTR